jgi:hypothetical protein
MRRLAIALALGLAMLPLGAQAARQRSTAGKGHDARLLKQSRAKLRFAEDAASWVRGLRVPEHVRKELLARLTEDKVRYPQPGTMILKRVLGAGGSIKRTKVRQEPGVGVTIIDEIKDVMRMTRRFTPTGAGTDYPYRVKDAKTSYGEGIQSREQYLVNDGGDFRRTTPLRVRPIDPAQRGSPRHLSSKPL